MCAHSHIFTVTFTLLVQLSTDGATFDPQLFRCFTFFLKRSDVSWVKSAKKKAKVTTQESPVKRQTYKRKKPEVSPESEPSLNFSWDQVII